MRRPWIPTAILLAAVLAGGAIRAVDVFSKPIFLHDESHTYQCATAHVGESAGIIYDHNPPYGRWVPASEWKRLLRPERVMPIGLIGSDALKYDVHPPLYYWLLHVACLAFGTQLWTGTLLNSLLDLITVVALYRLVKRATGDPLAAAVAAFVWATTAGALQAAVVEARMYSLLALITVLFVDRFAQYMLMPRPPLAPTGRAMVSDLLRPAWITLLTAAGALAHHHFGLVVAGAFGACLLCRRPTWEMLKRLAGMVGATVAGYVAVVLVHPAFFGTGYKHLSDTRLPDAAALAARWRQVAEAAAQFVLDRRVAAELPTPAVAVVAAVVPVLVLLAAWRAWRRRTPAGDDVAAVVEDPTPAASRYLVLLGVWLLAVTVGLYVSGVTPAHAMNAKYLSTGWPFVAAAVGVLFAVGGGMGRRRLAAVAVVCAGSLAIGVCAARLQWRELDWHPGAARADALVRSADRVVIDNVGRGHWPRPAWRLREDATVLIAVPNDLLNRSTKPDPKRTDNWRPDNWWLELAPGTVYISPAKSSEKTRQALIESFGRMFEIESVGHLYGIGDVYLFGARKVPPPSTRAMTRPTTRKG